MSRIAAIIVTYNRRNKLQRCMDAVLAQDAPVKPDLFIVDNAGSDGTDRVMEEYARNHPGRIHSFRLTENTGCAGGFNYGIRKAVEEGYDYLWLMDDDCIPAESALGEFLSSDSRLGGEYGFLSGKVLWRDGSLSRINIQRRTLLRNVKSWDQKEIKIAMASFASMFIPACIVYDVGLPIREFFIWTDDWEYSRRISRKYPCYLVTSSEVVHDMDTDINSKADISVADKDRLDRFRYLYRNDVYLYRREGIKGLCYEVARLAFHLMKIAFSNNSPAEKRRRAGILIKSTHEGMSFSPVTEKVQAPSEPRNESK